MNWPRIMLDGISMSLLFNAVVGVGFMLNEVVEILAFESVLRIQ